MSEIINNSEERIKILKDLIRKLHSGDTQDMVKKQLETHLREIPYDEVVRAEQELIAEGLPETEVIKLCDVHTAVLKGNIDTSKEKDVPLGHPVDIFKRENKALNLIVAEFEEIYNNKNLPLTDDLIMKLKEIFNSLMDVDKHYRRKENLLFPYLEKHGVTAPPKVMWAKHDETRVLIKEAIALLRDGDKSKPLLDSLKKATDAVVEMIYKEDQILLPMSLDTLNDEEWYNIVLQSPEIGFCLIDPIENWKPEGVTINEEDVEMHDGTITLPSGAFVLEELIAVFNTMPVDITFVDKNDTVRFFSQSEERIFDRNRAIIGRKVQMCHPPASVDTVEKILDDFKSGKETKAAFWIQMGDRFIHIEYFALKDREGKYLGTLEVSQDLTEKRSLKGERRLLEYE